MLEYIILCAATGVSVIGISNQLIELMEWARVKPHRLSDLSVILLKGAVFTFMILYSIMRPKL